MKTLLPTCCKSKAGGLNKSVSPLIFQELSPMSLFIRQCYKEDGKRGGRRRKPPAGASAWGRERRLAPASPSRLPRGTGEGGSDKVNVQTQKSNYTDGELCESEYKETKSSRSLDNKDFRMLNNNHARSNSSNDSDNMNNNNDDKNNNYNKNINDDNCSNTTYVNKLRPPEDRWSSILPYLTKLLKQAFPTTEYCSFAQSCSLWLSPWSEPNLRDWVTEGSDCTAPGELAQCRLFMQCLPRTKEKSSEEKKG